MIYQDLTNKCKFMSITIHNKSDFSKMREAGKLASSILDYIGNFVDIGITTNELNDLCHKKIIENGAVPAPLNYRGFPKSICTSVNHVVCHGIPSDKKLKNGDIINIDVTVILDGWHGDTSRMYYVGKPSIKAKKLCEVTYNALMIGIDQVKPGNQISRIGMAIQEYVEQNGFSVVREYCGHGIGRKFHDSPNILHFFDKKNNDPGQEIIMEEGMFFTIEPMVNLGNYKTILSKHDNWTVTTRDKSLSAQYEHTMGVTSDGVEVFT